MSEYEKLMRRRTRGPLTLEHRVADIREDHGHERDEKLARGVDTWEWCDVCALLKVLKKEVE